MKWLSLIIVGMAFVTNSTESLAGTLSFELMREYSGGDPPEGPNPWLTATFDDGGMAGTVDLTLEAANLIDTEFVGQWILNLDPTLDPLQLNFSIISTIGSFTQPAINTGVDAFHAGGDGLYDLQFDFDNSNKAGGRFGAGDTLVVEISGIPTLTASSFDFLSTSVGSSHGPFHSVAHIQGIGVDGCGSGWITAPEPSSMALSAMGFFTVFFWVWRSRDRGAA